MNQDDECGRVWCCSVWSGVAWCGQLLYPWQGTVTGRFFFLSVRHLDILPQDISPLLIQLKPNHHHLVFLTTDVTVGVHQIRIRLDPKSVDPVRIRIRPDFRLDPAGFDYQPGFVVKWVRNNTWQEKIPKCSCSNWTWAFRYWNET